MALNHNILLEVGTNEVELVEFVINNNNKDFNFAINVAKVREVLKISYDEITPMPNSNIEGMIKIRDIVIPVINLKKVLGLYTDDYKKDEKIYLLHCYFNTLHVSFIIDKVLGIQKVTWKMIETGGNLVTEQGNVKLVGVVKLPNKLIQLLDYEQIVANVAPELLENKLSNIEEIQDTDLQLLQSKKILFAEDSSVIRNVLKSLCNKHNLNAVIVKNGQELISTFKQYNPDIVVTDIEMPIIDGLTATKLIKQMNTKTKVIIFSSMYSIENEKKAKTVGIDAFVAKPDLVQLIETMKKL
ncbi:two-component system, chemotaxis family, response regulator CheV (plasmid) [Deferribacter desulfuricans SSM1]|uniref:Two-component system, chemotaxis family, response regulator CheV n=1 Tax=Deferribacter desulfuricans (strain DSM 14783 / JCM 11476 / NBRC 101012 / SSM1) TaxID=639282 RepID=D3PF12_DEFDS|nr:chemotaxis protein CheW [Deferribacter desulfuricans]BAI81804.1 two-component system, chemotaxis family, response regulator CheV [Deferribacter desulfuricans SSM1]